MPSNDLRRILAAWLTRTMKQAGLNQSTLAGASGVSRDTISRILLEKTGASDENLERLSKAVGQPLPSLSEALRYPEGGAEPPSCPLTGRVAEGRVSPGPKNNEALEGLWRQITAEMAEYERRDQDAPSAQLAGWLARLGATSAGGAGAVVSAEAEVERDATEATALDANTPPPRQGRQQKPGG